MQYFRQATALQPQNIDILIGLADALSQVGNAGKALECLDEVDSILQPRDGKLSDDEQQQVDAIRSACAKQQKTNSPVTGAAQ